MKQKLAVLMCVALAGSAVAYAGPGDGYGRYRDSGPYYGSGAYFGLSLGQLRYNEEGLDTITPVTAMAILGTAISPNLSVEGRLGGGLGRAETNTYGVEVRSLFAGYLKGSLPLAPNFSLYGLGGLASVDLQRDFGLVYARDSGFSYGLGMNFSLYGGGRLSLEWTRLATGNNLGYGYTVDQASAGIAWRF